MQARSETSTGTLINIYFFLYATMFKYSYMINSGSPEADRGSRALDTTGI